MHNHIWLCTIAKSKKRKKGFLFSIQFKIIFLCLFFFFSILLFTKVQTMQASLKTTFSQTYSLKLLPLCLTFSQTLTSLSHRHRPDSILNVTGPPKLDVTDPPADPLRRTPKPPVHASDPSQPSLMLSTLSNSHL